MKHTCNNCGKRFEHRQPVKKYCSHKCYREGSKTGQHNLMESGKHYKKIKKSYADNVISNLNK